jgi:hypothetical protein
MDLNAYIATFKGISGTGANLGELTVLLKRDFAISLEPGDFVSKGENSSIVTSVPVSADLWYLWNHVNGMTWIEKDEDPDLYMTERLAFFEDKLSGIKALKGLTTLEDVTRGLEVYSNDWQRLMAIQDGFGNWKNMAKAWFQLMVFELLFNGQVMRNNSEDVTPEDVVGYITFPVGQLGVMEVLSLVQESLSDDEDFEMQEDEIPNLEEPRLFPYFTDWILNKCYGRHLIESGYVVPEIEKDKYLFLAKSVVSETDYGRDVRPKMWARLWITRKDKFPVPGEFVGILCKALVVPPQCWWFQNSNPFLYAGNWFDTWDLTSGVVISKSSAAHPTSGVACTEYLIRIHGRQIYVYSSDFLVYNVSQRVGVLKIFYVTSEPKETSFDHRDQAGQGDPYKTPTVSVDYVIIPISFYQEVL